MIISASRRTGKSTMANILGCLDKATKGSYLFNGVDVFSLNRNETALLRRNYIGFIFQGFNLLARTTALENVELPLLYRGKDASIHAQIIIASQSKDLADYFDIDNISIVEMDKKNSCTNVRKLVHKDYEAWLEHYSVSELWDKNIIGGRPI